MSQSKLAAYLSITFQQVQKYERGVNRVSVSSLVVIAEALQCSIDDLLMTGDDSRSVAWERFIDREANAAVDAFCHIKSARVRRTVLDLMRTLGGE